MARIRSVHPGLFTDEAFAQLSDSAQVFWIGLWTEADDQGVFEWKPLTLKMRLRAASTSPVEPLLEELEQLNCVKRFSVDGRQYGAIRNFCRFQRPKKPNSIHPRPDEFRTYTGSDADSSEPDTPVAPTSSPPVPHLVHLNGHSVPPKSEIAPQMEDGGGRREKKEVVSKGVQGEIAIPPSVADAPPPAKRSGRRAPKRSGPIPEDWLPSEDCDEYAEKRIDPNSIGDEVDKFVQWHTAHGSRHVSWELAWKNWIDKAAEIAADKEDRRQRSMRQ